MITEEKMDKFVEDRYPNIQDQSAYVIKRILAHVKDYEEALGKDVECFTIEEFKILFEMQKWIVNRSSFAKNKSIIISYISWLQQVDGRVYDSSLKYLRASDLNKQSIFEDRYFKSEDDLFDFLNKGLNEEVYLRAKAIAVLSWVGFSLEKIPLLKKTDLDSESLTIKGRSVSRRIFYIVSMCANQDFYFVYSKDGKWKRYTLVDNEYIIRVRETKSSSNGHLPGEIMNNLIGKANKYIQNGLKYKKQMSAKAIMKSGLFYRLYELEQNGVAVSSSYSINSDLEDFYKVCSLFKEYDFAITEDNLSYIIISYREWKDYFYPNEK